MSTAFGLSSPASAFSIAGKFNPQSEVEDGKSGREGIPLERSFSIPEALERTKSLLTELALAAQLDFAGDLVITTKCILTTGLGEFVNFGYGKGPKQTSIAGAVYEAIEHHALQVESLLEANLTYEHSRTFIETTPLELTRPLRVLAESSPGVLPFRTYSEIGGSDVVLYPFALSNPRYLDELASGDLKNPSDSFGYAHLERYCTNNGVAIGGTEIEAQIHGLLEVVERHSLSQFLVQVFLKQDTKSMRLLAVESLPDELRDLYLKVEAEVKGRVLLVEIQNTFGIPCFCASIENGIFPLEVAGFGCSLSRQHALSRAMHELVQCYHVTAVFHPESVESRDIAVLAGLKPYPMHHMCAQMKLGKFCQEKGSLSINYSAAADQEHTLDPNKYLSRLISLLKSKGVRAYWSRIRTFSGGVHVGHCFIDGQDHFYCVTEGSLVFPNTLDHS